MSWWNTLTPLQQIFASVAIPATLIMLIQLILLIFGLSQGDGGDGVDAPADLDIQDGADVCLECHDPDLPCDHGEISLSHGSDGDQPMGESHTEHTAGLRLFTIRGMIAFMAVGGWMGVAAIGWKLPAPAVFLLVLISGALALYFVAWSLRLALKMQQSGNVLIENAIGKEGEVYIPVPRSRIGQGKVNVIVQERLCEFSAVTQADRALKTGEKVVITGLESEGVLLVMPKDNPPEGVLIEKY
jgi:membrane protein implicated in regulation of membrane protease activity